MSSLEDFFAAQARFYAAAADPAAAARGLAEAFPGWTHRPERVALYARFAVNHVRTLLEKVFPAARAALPSATWEALVDAYYATRPGRASFELNANARAFPGFVGRAPDLPAFVPALVRFEWAVQEVYMTRVEVPDQVERLAVNPTLDVVEHAWALVSYLKAAPPRAEPAAADETVLLWRRRETQLVHWTAATPRALLALKVAGEGLDPAAVAREGGVGLDVVEGALADGVRQGFLLAPGQPSSTQASARVPSST